MTPIEVNAVLTHAAKFDPHTGMRPGDSRQSAEITIRAI